MPPPLKQREDVIDDAHTYLPSTLEPGRSLLLRHQTFGCLIQLADNLIFCIIDFLKATDYSSRRCKDLRVFLLHGYQRALDRLTQAVWQVLPYNDRVVRDQFRDSDKA